MADKNQDKNQSKNRAEQAEEHDESVLNPEIKNESDLSKKERRLIEKEKLKGMGPKKKLEYIWMYYKPAIFGVIAVIALIFGIKDYYEQSKIKTVLSMTVVNSMANDTETPEGKCSGNIIKSVQSRQKSGKICVYVSLILKNTGNWQIIIIHTKRCGFQRKMWKSFRILSDREKSGRILQRNVSGIILVTVHSVHSNLSSVTQS